VRKQVQRNRGAAAGRYAGIRDHSLQVQR
jgi:hypothetical protein